MGYRIAAAAAIVLTALTARSVGAGILFADGFESGDTRKWKEHIEDKGGTSRLEISRQKVRAGQYAARFVCNGCHRVELTGVPKFEWYKEYWVGFSLYLPKAPTGFRNINQHHSTPGDFNWNCAAGGNSFTIKAANGSLDFFTSTIDGNVNLVDDKGGATRNTYKFDKPAPLNTWHDVVMHFRYAPNSTGFMHVWLNGTKIFDKSGITVYKYDACGKPREPLQYLKIGLYLGGGNGEVFYDEIRIGDANASYAAVAPGGGDAVSVGSSRLHRGAATVERESAVYDLRGRAISIAAATGRVAITVVRGSDAAPSTIIGIRR